MSDLFPVQDQIDAQLPPSLETIRRAIDASAADVRALDEAGDLDGLLVGIAAIDIIRRDLAGLRSVAGSAAAGHMGRETVVIDGVGMFERKADVKRTTDWDAILKEIRRRALVDPETGEVIDDATVAVDRCLNLIREIVPLYRSTGAKQGGLTGAGIDKEDVQDSEWKAANVVYRGVK